MELKEKEIEENRKRYEQELYLKERELQIQIDRERVSKTLISQTKLFADALKGSMPRMPSDVVHLLTYFKDVEQLFAKFEVPVGLQAQFLRPYLSEKATLLVSRMDADKASDYKAVKTMLLREFKLSPAVYLEKFNTDTRKQDETCLMYSARLVAILDAYLDSRKVDRNYDTVTQLLVCDRIKSTLPEGCLKHILAIESSNETGWLKVSELAEAIDLYFANRWQHGDRPRAGALGIPASTKPASVPGLGNRSLPVSVVRPPRSPNGGRKYVNTHLAPGELSRRCFTCGSKFHLKNSCPERNKVTPAQSNAKVNLCQVQVPSQIGAAHTVNTNEIIGQPIRAVDAEVQVCVEPEISDVRATQTQTETVDVNSITDDSQSLDNEYAKLQYIDVKIADQNNSNVKVVSGLSDSGAEISVLSADVLGQLEVPHVGKLKLRGIVGSPVSADLGQIENSIVSART